MAGTASNNNQAVKESQIRSRTELKMPALLEMNVVGES